MKNSLIIQLGIRILRNNPGMKAREAGTLARNFYRGCRTIREMQDRIQLFGGFEAIAKSVN